MRLAPLLVAAAVVLGLVGCSDDDDPDDAIGTTPGTEAEAQAGSDPALRDELLAMMAADQAERTGESAEDGDAERADRLREIIDEHGWPTFDLVGGEAATAAWVIAQHADFDPEFQQSVAELMRPLVEAGQADASELAYLEDRIAVNGGGSQVYGTQIRCRDGEVAPATPIDDEDAVDERRAAVGLEPLADYYATLEEACAIEG